MAGISGKGVSVSAENTDKLYGDYTYKILNDGTVSITKYKGKASEVHIPETVEGKRVTEVGEEAFADNLSISRVYLPKYLRIINKGAFYCCKKLNYISICEGLEKIGASAFDTCDLLEIKIPNSVSNIDESAFSCNARIGAVRMPQNLQEISDFLFFGCDNLKSVYISKNIKKIGYGAFAYCEKLNIIQDEKIFYTGGQFTFIPNSIESIGKNAFYECSNIKNLVFLNSDCWIVNSITTANLYGFKYSVGNKKLSTLYQYCNQFNKSFTEFIPMEGINLDSNNVELIINKNKTKKITITTKPSNCTVSQIYWSSSNEKIVKVDQQGNTTGISVGQAIITARSVDGSNLIKTCKVSVRAAITSLKLNKTKVSLNIEKNKSTQLSVKVLPSNAVNNKLNWKSSNTKVVSVDNKGRITAKKVGTARIIVSADGMSASCEVVVTPPAIKSLKASKQTTSTLTLGWTKVNGATGYSIYRYDTRCKKYRKIVDTKSTSYTVSKENGKTGKRLQSATAYSFKVVSYKEINGKKNYGGETEIKTATCPSKTKIITIKQIRKNKKNGIRLTWKKINNASGYMIYMSNKKKSGYKCIATLEGKNKTQYIKYGISAKKGYYFKVRTFKRVNKSIIKSGYSTIVFVKK